MEFEELVDRLARAFSSLGVVRVKAINYGKQLVLTEGTKKVTLNVYNGKKGVKTVWGGAASDLREKAETLAGEVLDTSFSPVSKPAAPAGAAHAVRSGMPGFLLRQVPEYDGIWMGSDESGKGDYMGPLVAAAVCVDEACGAALIRGGVRDCKTLSDAKIRSLASFIREHSLACSVKVLLPEEYNAVYAQYRARGQSLNALLVQAHADVLADTGRKVPACRLALIDQFMRADGILRKMGETCPQVTTYCRPRAEEDIAVAAASVLARAHFLHALEALAADAGVPALPKGGGSAATDAAAQLLTRFGRDKLGHFVKLHFANTKSL
ncbi:MAG: ribonuclease HIII [Succiniclasticum sp.]|jgi:ribonuclease HIII|nr:ribonuclease HIII [Succiniclasticum sp.]MEE3479639.1 ribonuclease HIII [Succiniclasticum sp.]